MSLKRREFLAASAALAAAACGTAPEESEMPIRLPSGRPVPINPVPKNPIYTQKSSASPLHLSSSLVLASGTNGTPPNAALKNPMGQDMEILEIKFEVSGKFSDEKFVEVFGGTIACELVMGTYKITNGSIPVWNFGRAENVDREQQIDATDDLAVTAYTWRLPRPLFVPAGAVVTPNFTHTALSPNTLNVRVGYSARTVFTKPKRIYMPWVAKYLSKSFNPLSAGGVDSSTDLDLVNPHIEPFNIQRFVGRTLTVDGTGSMHESTPLFFNEQTLNVRMADSYGRPIVRSFTPFRSVFTPLTRSWDMDNGAQLDPESFYRVDLRVDPITTDPFNPVFALTAGQAFISMIGWRELESF